MRLHGLNSNALSCDIQLILYNQTVGFLFLFFLFFFKKKRVSTLYCIWPKTVGYSLLLWMTYLGSV